MNMRPTPHQLICVLTAMNQIVRRYELGAEMGGPHEGCSEFDPGPDWGEMHNELLRTLIENGMLTDLNAFVAECARAFGWRLLLRRFLTITLFTRCGADADHEADRREYMAQNTTFYPEGRPDLIMKPDSNIHFSPATYRQL